MTEHSIRFASDPRALRSEDQPLLTGRALFTDDLSLPGQLYAVFARSPHAHARIGEIDVTRALKMPGVAAVFTGKDVAEADLGPIPMAMRFKNSDGTPMALAPLPVLPRDRVRYVGEAFAMVVAETVALAQDAVEQLVAEFDELPAATTARAAQEVIEPIWREAPDNIALDWEDGDAEAVDNAFSTAAHVVTIRLEDTRVAPSAMEPRAAIGEWDPEQQRFTLTAGTQGVALVRKMFAEHVFNVPLDRIRVRTYDVGGGFGMKVQPYAEYAAVMFAARCLGRPVKWTATRVESFLTDTHGRDGVLDGALALDAQGRFLALRMHNTAGIGAYVSTFASVFSTNNTKNCLANVYTTPALHFRVQAMLTNAAPVGPYRGAGRPEAIYLVERLIDKAARATGIDRIELRRRNMISPTAIPYSAPNGQKYDSGDFEAVMDKALDLADWKGFAKRHSASRKEGKLRGIGLCSFLEVAGGILDESVDLRIEPDGTAALRLGVQSIGQGHLTTFTRIVADALGIAAESVRLIEGDSDEAPKGWPTVASRSAMMAGSATFRACEEIIEKGRLVAGSLLEAATADITYEAGVFSIVGTDRRVSLGEVAGRAREMTNLPEHFTNGLDTVAEFVSSGMSFPNGCHVCEVEIDRETGEVKVVGYVAVDDVGVILNEPIVEGQIHGGIAQGLGQVLGEQVIYDDNGQLQTASFMDYRMPRAMDFPQLRLTHHVAPCATNPLGVKGAGESGVAGAIPAAMNAIHDALSHEGIEDFDMPATPARVWKALNGRL
ncbi:xanthine dehydrogenase family protein molybdopterin-binding subunit [Aquibaculum sediminis]|uniref:xanthine dehydrogenase family protein molybdopterin-binding subunit n=1 Tax=Aquibaculum sediminis TaxID=3231907 RepID=UPI0034537A9A